MGIDTIEKRIFFFKVTRRQHKSDQGQLEDIIAQIHLSVRLVHVWPQSKRKYYWIKKNPIHGLTRMFGKIMILIIKGCFISSKLKFILTTLKFLQTNSLFLWTLSVTYHLIIFLISFWYVRWFLLAYKVKKVLSCTLLKVFNRTLFKNILFKI